PANADVRAMASYKGDLYVAGKFEALKGNLTVNHIARWNGTDGWRSLMPGIPNPIQGVAGAVPIIHDLEVFTNAGTEYLAMGGRFSSAFGSLTDKVALWNGSAISNTNAGSTFNSQRTILDLHAIDALGRLYAYGDFTSIEGEGVSGLAYWDGGAWQNANDPGATFLKLQNIDDNVACMAACGGELYVGGSFEGAFGAPFNVFRHNVGANSSHDLDASHNGTDGRVNDMLYFDNRLYMAGAFTKIQGANGGADVNRDRATWFSCGVFTEAEDIVEENEGRLYPNPASSSFRIQVPENGRFEVSDMNGRRMVEGEWVRGNDKVIEVENWPAGMYMCRMVSEKGKVMMKKVVVEK
ncbi:MAG: T9SS type A sorting domain-containing protein, partial [Bacteroidota bacterium]